MTDRLTPGDLDAINRRALRARAYLSHDPDITDGQGEAALRDLADVDVPTLLLKLEEATTTSDDAYVRGLSAAARFLSGFDQDILGLDRVTCAQLAAGVNAMADSARKRLGVDGGPAMEALLAFQSQNAYVGYAALREVANPANLRHALCEMLAALDRVASGTAETGAPPDRPLLPAEQEEFAARFGGAR